MVAETMTSAGRGMKFGTIPCPVPGVYPNIPFETYCGWDALNHSKLRRVGKSPMHFHDAPPDKETDSKVFGVGFHEMMLEPARFAARVVMSPINEKTGKPFGRDTKAWAEFAALRPGKLILTPEEMDQIVAMRARITSHPEASLFFDPASGAMFEVCIVWDCPITGLRCKGRVDVWVPRPNQMVARLDLKTTADASTEEFGRSIVKYGYHTQDAFYEMGCKALGHDSYGLLLPIESDAPHAMQLAPIEGDTLAAGRHIVEGWLRTVKHCRETDSWPGYEASSSVAFKAPEWYLKQFATATESN